MTELPGYIVIALIAFSLGIAVTIFCMSLKKLQAGKNDYIKKDNDKSGNEKR